MRAVLIFVFALAGCDLAYSAASYDRFEIEAEATEGVTAEIRLCGRTQDMEKTSFGFRSRFQIDCEGSGEIVVRKSGQDSRSCMIGYVTSNAGQEFQYRLTEDSCDPILPPAT